MKLISEDLQNKLPAGTKIEFINGDTNSLTSSPGYNAGYDNRDTLDKLQITFSNGFILLITTVNYKGIIIEEKQTPL